MLQCRHVGDLEPPLPLQKRPPPAVEGETAAPGRVGVTDLKGPDTMMLPRLHLNTAQVCID